MKKSLSTTPKKRLVLSVVDSGPDSIEKIRLMSARAIEHAKRRRLMDEVLTSI